MVEDFDDDIVSENDGDYIPLSPAAVFAVPGLQWCRGFCGTWFAMVHLGHTCGSKPYVFQISRAQLVLPRAAVRAGMVNPRGFPESPSLLRACGLSAP